ncbi:MAG: hypothetical protein LC721_10030 [Actinobacteria bacterium]|nr:hypothetical protein [Actinomycetota bacterium]
MTDEQFTDSTCSSCGHVFPPDDLALIRTGTRSPCPSCGATSRTFAVHCTATATAHAQLSLKARRPGLTFGKGKNKKRHFMEQVVGEDLERSTRRWNHLSRVIDRLKGEYHEKITDADGNVIREVHERLRDHIGRGSARRRPDR